MSTRYRVVVEQIDDVEDTQYETRETVLFSTESPNASSLLRYAPTEVASALSEAAGIAEPWGEPARPPVAPVGVTATVFNSAGEVIEAIKSAEPGDTIPVTPQQRDAVEQLVAEAPKRKRRTKAEIAADKAREAAEAMAADAINTAQVGGAADTVVEQLTAEAVAEHNVPITDPQDVTGVAHASQAVERPAPVAVTTTLEKAAPVPAAEPAPSGPGEFYNPFAAK